MSTIETAPKVCVELKTKIGYALFWRPQMLKRFEEDLQDLLAEAGYQGNFSVRQNGVGMKGSPHLQGITIGTSSGPHWVEICAQYGDNGSRDTWRIFFPHEDTQEDLQKLKGALPRLKEKSKALPAIGKKEPETFRLVSRPVQESSSSDGNDQASPTAEARKEGLGEATVTGPVSHANFFSDEKNIEKLLDMAVIEAEGPVFNKTLISTLMVSEFGYPSKGVGPIHRSLQSRGLVVISQDSPNLYRLTEEATKKLTVATPLVPSSSSAPATYDVPNSVLDKLASLQRQASQFGPEQEAKLTELVARREQLETEIAQLTALQREAEEARAKIKAVSQLLD